jgi:hypothetical protein
MLLMSLTNRYRAISREVQGGKPPERSIDVQTRFVYSMARSLSRTEVQMCLEQLRARRRGNQQTQSKCVKTMLFWLVLGLVWIVCVPSWGILGTLPVILHGLAFFYLRRLEKNLVAIERCLSLLKTL